MVNILEILKSNRRNGLLFHKTIARNAFETTSFDKGIDCILKTQYKQNGQLTAWCAQHDVLPAKAQTYNYHH
jgi:pectinesterase